LSKNIPQTVTTPLVIIPKPSLTPHLVSAHDPAAPYFDPSSSPDDPKWSLVHVSFRQKLETPITLKDLKTFQAEKDSPLANMQMLKLTRLSVSRVSSEEWEFLISAMKKNGDEILVQ
jgi:predicted RNA-binding protein with PUA-like domain